MQLKGINTINFFTSLSRSVTSFVFGALYLVLSASTSVYLIACYLD